MASKKDMRRPDLGIVPPSPLALILGRIEADMVTIAIPFQEPPKEKDSDLSSKETIMSQTSVLML